MAPITQNSKSTIEFETSTTINTNTALEIHCSNNTMEISTSSNTIIKIGLSSNIIEIDSSNATASEYDYISTVEIISSKMSDSSMSTVIILRSSDIAKGNSEIFEVLGTTAYGYLFGILLFILFICVRRVWCGSVKSNSRKETVKGDFKRGNDFGDQDDVERGLLKKKRIRTADSVEAPLLPK